MPNQQNEKRHVAVDLGSSRIRYGLGHLSQEGDLNVLSSASKSVRSGKRVFKKNESGEVSDKAQKKIVETISNWQEGAWADLNAAVITAHGTSALRESINGPEVQRRIENSTGVAVQLLSPEDEAATISNAIIKELDPTIPLRGKTVLIIDLGGGSTEFCLVINGKLCRESVRSIPIGTMRPALSGEFDSSDERSTARARIKREIVRALDAVREFAPCGEIDLVAGSGGNIREYGAMQKKVVPGHNGQTLSAAELGNLISLLESVPKERRADVFSIGDARADIIVPAGQVFSMCLAHLEIDQIRVAQSGLRHGLLLRSIQALETEQRESNYAIAEQSARRFCFGFSADIQLAQRRADFVAAVFDSTAVQHGLERPQRALLRIAAMVRDVGQTFTDEAPCRKSAELLSSQPFEGLNFKDKAFIANLIRQSEEDEGTGSFQERLPQKEQLAFAAMLPIFRLGSEMSDASENPHHDFSLRVNQGTLEIKNLNGFPKGALKDIVRGHERPIRRALQLELAIKKAG